MPRKPKKTEPASTSTVKLTPYRGRNVTATSIAIRNAGDGLSKAMAIEPVEFEIGDRVFVVLECEVAHHDFEPVGDTGDLELKQVFKADGATMVDEDLVRAQLDVQAERIRVAEDEAAGRARLPLEPDDPLDALRPTDEELLAAHVAGLHADDRVPACVECSAEIEAEQQEKE